MAELAEHAGLPVSVSDVMSVLDERAFRLPDHPRVWRLSAVRQWAESNGRTLADHVPGSGPTA